MTTHSKILEAILKAISYPTNLTDFDFSHPDSIRFMYSNRRFRVDKTGFVEEAKDGMLASNEHTEILEELIKPFFLGV